MNHAQRADAYESVCGGGLSCDVPDGTYVVINHAAGMRYNNITVPIQPAASDVVIFGNTISWPDNGWYQVQNAFTYDSVCEGGLSCDVPNGNFIVINHTTGERYDNVVVNKLADNEQYFGSINIDEVLPNLLRTAD